MNHVKLFNLSSNESKCYIADQTTEVMEKFKRLCSGWYKNPEAEREQQLLSFFHICFVPKELCVNICLLNTISNKGDETSGHF